MAETSLPPIPTDADVITGDKKLSSDYYTWLFNLWERVLASAFQAVETVRLIGQTAAIASTPIAAAATTGMFRIAGYLRVTTPAGVSSSVALIVTWLDGGVPCSKTLIAAVTGNTTASFGDGQTSIDADAGSIAYHTTYASNPAAVMAYKLTLSVEQVP